MTATKLARSRAQMTAIKTMTAEENLPARLGAILDDVERLIEVYEATPEESAIRPVRNALRAAIRALGGEV